MIQSFKQFINESNNTKVNILSNNEKIDNIFSNIITASQDKFNKYITNLSESLTLIDNATELIMQEFGEYIIDEPKIDMELNQSKLFIQFATNLSSDEYDIYAEKVDKILNDTIKNQCVEFNDKWHDRGGHIYINMQLDENQTENMSITIEADVPASLLIKFYIDSNNDSEDNSIKQLEKYIFE